MCVTPYTGFIMLQCNADVTQASYRQVTGKLKVFYFVLANR